MTDEQLPCSFLPMRLLTILLLFPILVSCGPPAVLVVDEPFRAATPEVVRAWAELGPWRTARTVSVSGVGGRAQVLATISNLPAETPVIIGALLSAEDCRFLVKAAPSHLITFLAPGTDGLKTISVDRTEVEKAVAAAAASRGGKALAFFRPGTGAAETEAFRTSWNNAGGGPLDITTGQITLTPPRGLGQIFLWNDDDSGSPLPKIPENVLVNGNPGQARAAGTKGFEWSVKTEGLGDFLWNTTHSLKIKTYILPIETVFISR